MKPPPLFALFYNVVTDRQQSWRHQWLDHDGFDLRDLYGSAIVIVVFVRVMPLCCWQ